MKLLPVFLCSPDALHLQFLFWAASFLLELLVFHHMQIHTSTFKWPPGILEPGCLCCLSFMKQLILLVLGLLFSEVTNQLLKQVTQKHFCSDMPSYSVLLQAAWLGCGAWHWCISVTVLCSLECLLQAAVSKLGFKQTGKLNAFCSCRIKSYNFG